MLTRLENKYIIQIQKTEMKKRFITYLLAMAVVFNWSCRKIEVDGSSDGGNDVEENLILEGKISKDRVLSSGNEYRIRGIVYVVDGATLTIEPGVVIVGEKGATSRGTLVITKGSKIIADGTKDKPIVFTSSETTPQRGDWGGLVILGNAPTNASFNGQQGVGSIEGGVNNAEQLGTYGGVEPNDNSGILRYVRIEYAGYAYLPDNEINGLTLAGVGKGTIIDYVEVFKANDDAFECFGGTVDLRHVVALSTLDDDFDTDNGYAGTVQWAIVIRDSSVADISKSNGMESDNDANGSTLSPITSAVFSNMTIVGPRQTLTNLGSSNNNAGMHLRRNTSISVFNSVIMGFPIGILLDGSKGTPTDLNISTESMQLMNNVVAGCNNSFSYAASTSSPTGWTTTAFTDWFLSPENSNELFTNNSELGLTAPFNYTNPDITPSAGSILLSGSSFTESKLSNFTPVSYRGACGSADADWWTGWTKLDMTK